MTNEFGIYKTRLPIEFVEEFIEKLDQQHDGDKEKTQ